MKKPITRILPHLTIVFSLMTLTFFVIDRINVAMAFMSSEQSKWVFTILAALSCPTAIMLIYSQWREDVRAARREAKRLTRKKL